MREMDQKKGVGVRRARESLVQQVSFWSLLTGTPISKSVDRDFERPEHICSARRTIVLVKF